MEDPRRRHHPAQQLLLGRRGQKPVRGARRGQDPVAWSRSGVRAPELRHAQTRAGCVELRHAATRAGGARARERGAPHPWLRLGRPEDSEQAGEGCVRSPRRPDPGGGQRALRVCRDPLSAQARAHPSQGLRLRHHAPTRRGAPRGCGRGGRARSGARRHIGLSPVHAVGARGERRVGGRYHHAPRIRFEAAEGVDQGVARRLEGEGAQVGSEQAAPPGLVGRRAGGVAALVLGHERQQGDVRGARRRGGAPVEAALARATTRPGPAPPLGPVPSPSPLAA
mmetsp:Transcript_26684/g.50743  ORF Transcript_26684/g.50743 Transcript_26684/m.50743 type:complete len:281 (+) Transcript_26684:532-1374(+)